MTDETKQAEPKAEQVPVFYAEGIVIHRNEVVIEGADGPKILPACKVFTMSPAYMGTIAGVVDLINVGWAVLAEHERRKLNAHRVELAQEEAADATTH